MAETKSPKTQINVEQLAIEILSKQTGKTIEEINDSEPFYLHQGEVIEAMKEIYKRK